MRILYNARIVTLDASRPIVSAMAVDHGRILAMGDDDSILSRFERRNPCQDDSQAPAEIRLHNLHGQTVIPGLVDAHVHLEHYALGLQKVDCETNTLEECLHRVEARAAVAPEGAWVLGHGWNQNSWENGYGSAADLDAISPGRPVHLTAKSLHASWANSQALKLAGVSAETPDPPGGRIGRDDQGNPNGILYESAMELIYRILPEPAIEEVMQAIREAQHQLWQMGLTGVHDYDQRRCFVALQLLHQKRAEQQFPGSALGLRVVKGIPLEDLPHAAALGLCSGFGDDFLRIGSVKAFMDGALGPRTAAMLQPYEGKNSDQGMLLMDGEELFEHGRLAVDSRLSVAVHAIGDRANHEVLNAFRQLRQYEHQKGYPALRHRIEHVQLLHPDDAGRLSEYGIIASMQPVHVLSDMEMATHHWGDRSALSYAWRTQLQHGAHLAFGSDAPVESPNPFWGLYAAVTRRRVDGYPGPEGWYPLQRLMLNEALQAFTQGAAYAAGMEDRLGKLAPGFLADLVVLPEDLFACEPEQLRDMHPVATMVDGDWVYIAPNSELSL